jgi:hypothetical protein
MISICHNRKLWLRQQSRSFPTAKTRAVGEETLSQQENSTVGKEIFANSPKSNDLWQRSAVGEGVLSQQE